jgi:hypothetical protein
MPTKLKRPAEKPRRARNLDLVAPWAHIKNAKPGFKYCLVNKELHGQPGGPGYYEARGWEYVRWEKDGERFAAGTPGKEGDILEAQGQVLMRIDEETWEDMNENGNGLGGTGLASHRRVMDHIIDKSNKGYDPTRGVHGLRKPSGGRYVGIRNETEPLEPEPMFQ